MNFSGAPSAFLTGTYPDVLHIKNAIGSAGAEGCRKRGDELVLAP
jgi:hypothetical protein